MRLSCNIKIFACEIKTRSCEKWSGHAKACGDRRTTTLMPVWIPQPFAEFICSQASLLFSPLLFHKSRLNPGPLCPSENWNYDLIVMLFIPYKGANDLKLRWLHLSLGSGEPLFSTTTGPGCWAIIATTSGPSGRFTFGRHNCTPSPLFVQSTFCVTTHLTIFHLGMRTTRKINPVMGLLCQIWQCLPRPMSTGPVSYCTLWYCLEWATLPASAAPERGTTEWLRSSCAVN